MTVFRCERAAAGLLRDLNYADGVVAVQPSTIPANRPELQTRYLLLGPADVDLGFAGRHPDDHRVHADLAAIETGDPLRIVNGALVTRDGRTVGRLSKSARLRNGHYAAKVTGLMVRAREQTPPPYQASVRANRWEVVLAEAIEPPRISAPPPDR